MKRSSWASGSGYVPSCSIGFCVASTKNGDGSGVGPAADGDLQFSCMAWSSAACVLGGVRLISSASRMLANTGPLTKRNCRPPVERSSSMISVPVMSDGIRSGVNWMRLNSRSMAEAMVRTISVLARPGTPIIRQWPRANSAVSRSIDDVLLADDDLGDLFLELLAGRAEAGDGLQVARGRGGRSGHAAGWPWLRRRRTA